MARQEQIRLKPQRNRQRGEDAASTFPEQYRRRASGGGGDKVDELLGDIETVLTSEHTLRTLGHLGVEATK